MTPTDFVKPKPCFLLATQRPLEAAVAAELARLRAVCPELGLLANGGRTRPPAAQSSAAGLATAQALSRLCRMGFVQRVRFGEYRRTAP